MIMIEKQYFNVTPKQAQFFIELAIKKADPNRLCGVDVDGVINTTCNTSGKVEVKNGKRISTDYTQKAYVRINYDENGSGKVVDYPSRYYEYKERGYQTWEEDTDEADYTEIYREKPGDYQYYRKSADGCYNETLEFNFDTETKGWCYFYLCDTTEQ